MRVMAAGRAGAGSAPAIAKRAARRQAVEGWRRAVEDSRHPIGVRTGRCFAAAILTVTAACSPRTLSSQTLDDDVRPVDDLAAAELPPVPQLAVEPIPGVGPDPDRDGEPPSTPSSERRGVSQTTDRRPDRAFSAGRPPTTSEPRRPTTSEPGRPPGDARPDRPASTARRLIAELADADRQTARLVRSPDPAADPATNRRTLIETLRRKRDLARRLSEDPDADASDRDVGRRAMLQATSGLASLGDRDAAAALPSVAAAAIESDRPGLVDDGRAVLLQLELGALAGGDETAADRIINLSRELIVSRDAAIRRGTDDPADAMAAMVTLGRVRETLAAYDRDEAAAEVRDNIVALYGSSADQRLASAASATAGMLDYREVDDLLDKLIEGSDVPIDDWRAALRTMVDLVPDLQTVRYLATASVQLESLGRDRHAAAIDEILDRTFTDPDTPIRREIDLAAAARRQRRDVIGRTFDPDADTLDGRPLSIADYRGRPVVLVFWTADAPESLAMLSAAASPAGASDAVIVGVNLDADPPPAGDFPHPSFHIPTTDAGNPAASAFGIVSLPAAAVLDREGRVAGLALAPEQLPALLRRVTD